MSSLAIPSIVFAVVFGGGLLGMALRRVLPEHHRDAESKDVAKLAMGLIATMSALVLSLLVASAKDTYDSQAKELGQLSANVVVLDRMLAHYGPESAETRAALRSAVERVLSELWSSSEPHGASARNEALFEAIQQLEPEDDAQRAIRSQAVSLVLSIGETRWLMFGQATTTVSRPMLVVLVSWLSMLFVTFGLFAPRNATVISIFAAAALSVSGAILLILEMYAPFSGLIEISNAPLVAALAQLGR